MFLARRGMVVAEPGVAVIVAVAPVDIGGVAGVGKMVAADGEFVGGLWGIGALRHGGYAENAGGNNAARKAGTKHRAID